MNGPTCSSVVRRTLWIIVAVCVVWTPLRADDESRKGEDADSQAEQLRRAAYVRTMQTMARGCKVVRITDESEVECRLVEDSVLNWSDLARHPDLIVPGTAWIWHDRGRPQFIGEIYGRVDLVGQWNFFGCSVSADRVRFGSGAAMWTSGQSYYGPTDIPDAPSVATTKAARSFQMRRLVSRFDGHQFWDGRFELRLLPQPIYRYEDAAAGVIDGAVYALVHGTNPEVVLLIEAHAADDQARWKVGFGSLAGARCVVRLDGDEFWTCPHHGGDPNDPRQGFRQAVAIVDLQE